MDEASVRKNLIWCPVLALFLAACGTGEASSIAAQAKAEPADLRAEARSDLESSRCQRGDGMKLVILEGGREMITRDYCSAYGSGGARLVTDRRGEHFVLLDYSEGRGTGVTSGHLVIYRVADGYLDERARLLAWDAAGQTDYRAATPRGGGIVISGRWIPAEQMLVRHRPPPRRATILEIDTTAESRS